jgi:late competence protein required for DNA uptake (superfamily II DNA/RNA helicase)
MQDHNSTPCARCHQTHLEVRDILSTGVFTCRPCLQAVMDEMADDGKLERIKNVDGQPVYTDAKYGRAAASALGR